MQLSIIRVGYVRAYYVHKALCKRFAMYCVPSKKMKGYTSSGHEHPILAYISVFQLFSFAATDSIRF
jgi:hypothetical protein